MMSEKDLSLAFAEAAAKESVNKLAEAIWWVLPLFWNTT